MKRFVKTIFFVFLLLMLGCQKENNNTELIDITSKAKSIYDNSLKEKGTNKLFDKYGIKIAWDDYKIAADGSLIISTRISKQPNNNGNILGRFELHFEKHGESYSNGSIKYFLPWKQAKRADYIAYDFTGKIIRPKASLKLKGDFDPSNTYQQYFYPTDVVKRSCPANLYFNIETNSCEFIWNMPIGGNITPMYWEVNYENLVSRYYLAPLDDNGTPYYPELTDPSYLDMVDVVAYPEYRWYGGEVFYAAPILNPYYIPNSNDNGSGSSGGGGGSGSGPGTGSGSGTGYTTDISKLNFDLEGILNYYEDEYYNDNGISRPRTFDFWLEVEKTRSQATGLVIGIVSVTPIPKKPIDEYINAHGERVVRELTVLPSTVRYTPTPLGNSYLIMASFMVNAVYKYYDGALCTKIVTRQYERTGGCIVW
ncbi:hypothetical protein D7322_15965 [Sphingobacterium puteale]|uniref:Lipoprotein n=1 Tax=Sphingobacterium puteale TaxID=2420510 RepID=A0A420VWL0_9SPHI|nr:hypothetical protein [Sphingobacterium puteale]RKO70763.1 hypothetical protein D7322_15965 [Sphingobacterium puteale]